MFQIVLGNDKTEYTINIRKGTTPGRGYLNDLENRPIAQPERIVLNGRFLQMMFGHHIRIKSLMLKETKLYLLEDVQLDLQQQVMQ